MKRTKADILWADLVKERDGYTCQRCLNFFPEGHRRGLHAHHIFGRGRAPQKHMKYRLANGVTLCYGDHMWAHQNPLDFYEWIPGVIGAEQFDDLQQLSRVLKKRQAV